uniref:MitMem_reg domain-containing protein n=1 Tax=Macrostomum lignano TaxID=282301 RepID=A0A1I8FYA4_9PLAT
MSQHSSKVAVKSAADVGVGGEFTELEREKTVMLEELVTLRCDDIAKVTPFSVAVDPEEIRVDEAAEKMLTTLADQVVSESLSAAADAAQLHLTAVRLVGLTVESAQRRLHRMNSSSSNASASSRAAFD